MGLGSGGKVVPMTGKGTADAPGYGLLQEVRAYWQGLRPGTGRPEADLQAPALPDRASIDPRGLDRALSHVFLVERIAPGLARFRIAGMHLADLMGMEVRGMPLSAMFDTCGREQMQKLLEQVFAGPAVLELALEGERGIGRPSLEGRMILLPVRGDSGECDRALGCIVTLGPVGRTPRRFAIARQVTEMLGTPKAIQPRPAPTMPAGRMAGFAEPASTFAPAPMGAAPRYPHLRLVKTGQ